MINTSQENIREVASDNNTNLSYEKMECPSSREYEDLRKKINFVGDLNGERCDAETDKGKFAKLLKYMSSVKYTIPKSWKGGAVLALRNPLNYLDKMSNKVDLDLKQESTMAFNRGKGDIYLGAEFFSSEPLSALLTLIHEARHSSPDAQSHIRCKHGDRAQSLRACDRWFRTDDKAGAYAYTVSFAFGLAKFSENISRADREFLIADGLAVLARRFLSVPEFLGLPFETLVVLDDESNLYYIHPILNKLIPYDYGEKLDLSRIKYFRANDGLYLITKSGKIYYVRASSKAKRFGTDWIEDDVFVKDIEVLTWDLGDGRDSRTKSYFLDKNNTIFYIDFDSEKRESYPRKSNYQVDGVALSQIIQAHGATRYVLTDGGVLGYFDPESPQYKIKKSVFQDPRGMGWVDIDGGKSYSDMFGVNKAGELFFRAGKTVKKSIFQVKNSRNYLEPSNFRVQVDKKGNIYIRRYNQDSILMFDSNNLKIKSVAYIRTFLADNLFGISQKISEEAESLCGLSNKSSIDPWTKRAMGINKDGELIFQVSDSKCATLQLEGEVQNYRFSGTEIEKAGDFSTVYLEVTFSSGQKKKIYPYSY